MQKLTTELNNTQTLLVLSPATMGKTFCLRHIGQLGRTFYINCDRKPLPFKPVNIATEALPTPLDILPYIQAAEASDEVELIVIDTVTQLGSDYVTTYVETAENKLNAWGAYKNFMMALMVAIKAGSKPYVVIAHEEAILDEATGIIERKAPFQGSFAKIGLEANFTTIVGCAVLQPSKIPKEHENDLLIVTDQEKEEDLKYVFQTRKTAATRGVKYRAAMGVWNQNELYIDNNVVPVIQRLAEYYK